MLPKASCRSSSFLLSLICCDFPCRGGCRDEHDRPMRLSGVYRAANDGDDADAAVAAPVACAGAVCTAGDCGLVVATVVGDAQVAGSV